MEIRTPQTQADRIAYILSMQRKLYPDQIFDKESKIKGTSVSKLCEYGGPGYERVKKWCENTLADKEITRSAMMALKPEVKFSGIKDTYEGGATRDSRDGKGRYDLISPLFLRRLAKVLEAGAKNHGDNNWKGGIKYSRLIDSSLRHISQFNSGMRDEDHITQAVCNLMFLTHFEEEGRTDLNDLIKSNDQK